MKKYHFLFIFLLVPSFIAPQQFELPEPYGPVYHYKGYSLQYNEQFEQADWTAYELTKEETEGKAHRTNNFRPDPAISTGSAGLSDYRGSGFDRGHLVPAGDLKWSQQAMSESFLMSNISPKIPAFNRQIWRILEEQVRQWAVENEKLLISSGPIITDNYKTIGENRVAVPAFFFKVIMDYTEPELKGIGFIIPNEKAAAPLQAYAVKIDDVEEITGIDFFYQIPEEVQERIESAMDISLWSWKSSSIIPLK